MKTLALLGWALVIGALAGILLDVATFLVARYGPEADSWSFRGNGALAVPFGAGPAILAGGWTALAFRNRGFARWLLFGFSRRLVSDGFVLLGVLVLVLFGSDTGAAASNALTLLTLGWMVVAPWLARFVRAPAEQARRGQRGGRAHARGGCAGVHRPQATDPRLDGGRTVAGAFRARTGRAGSAGAARRPRHRRGRVCDQPGRGFLCFGTSPGARFLSRTKK